MAPPPDPDDDAPETAPTAALDTTTGAAMERQAALFSPGEVLAQRFRIVAFLGRGGMGEVYEAEDLELREPVALKTIRAGLARDEHAMERFRREIQLARKVTHPNVSRLFDLGHHVSESGDITYLTMELLHGQTLSERLRAGRIPIADAGLIVEQMAQALAAAHQAGVVHRDFKPGNVILTPTSGGNPPRAVVTDFGLACLSGEVPGGVVVGTLAYMSPETKEGREATPASDVFALGVVMHEMVTGARPEDGEAKLADLDPKWQGAIRRCLKRDPVLRPRAADVVKTLTGADEAQPVRPRRWRWALAAALAVVVAALAWWGKPRNAPSAMRDAVQVTSSTGLDAFPSFSPDGKSIVYSSDRTGSFQLYVRALEPGGHDTAITSRGDNFQPAWSPDGRWIAYHSRGGGIFLLPARGGRPKQLTSFGSRPAWSPDGTTLAFQSEALFDLGANSFPALPPSALWLVSRDGGEARPLTRPGQPPGGHGAPSWSPDGRRIVFGTSDRRLAEVWSVAADGTGLVQIVQKQPYMFDPTYGPDGRVYYASWSSRFAYAIWAVRLSPVDGKAEGEPEEVTSLASLRLRHLAVSRDGRRIVYSAQGLIGNLWLASLSPDLRKTEGSPRPLTSETGKIARPAFSPDGTQIAFDRGRPGNPTDIWVMDADGKNFTSLTTAPTEDNLPSWFPDGSRVAFLSDRNGRIAIWSVGIRDKQESLLLDPAQDVDWPRLSPDGRTVAFNSKKGGGTINTWLASLDGGAPRQLTFDKELMGFPCWSPDGTLLAVEMKRGEDTHIAVVPGGGGTPEQLTSDPGQSWPYSFSPDGDWIAFAGLREGVWNVWTVSRKTREQRRLTNHAKLNAYVRTPAWSGNRIVYEYAETTGNIWMIERAP